MKKKRKKKMSSSKIIMLGFMAIILFGAILLTLPIASASWQWTSFSDALFTAVSATCVTGLIVKNTATYWSPFGQFVIMLLIQIGGMGFMMVALAFFMFSGRKIGLVQRSIMQDTISATQVGGIVQLTRFILKGLICIEGSGAVLLSIVFVPRYGLKGLWYGLFHSVSAFCNAGFDLCGVTRPFVSLTDYVTSPLLNIVIMGLIIIGGLGFLTWEDIKIHKWHFKKYRLQTKIIVLMTAGLISVPFMYFFLIEYRRMPLDVRFWGSLFQSVTPRTAGFNTMDYGAMSESGKLLTIILMLIGASPGSTAGGMKTTTVGVLLVLTLAVCRRRSQVSIYKRNIPQSTIYHAVTIVVIYVMLCLFGAILICGIDHFPLIDCLFETASAIGTVGLTVGITTKLSMISKMILMILMYLGRVGGLTIIYAAIPQTYMHRKYITDNVAVG